MSPAILARVALTGAFFPPAGAIGITGVGVILASGLISPARDMVARRRFGWGAASSGVAGTGRMSGPLTPAGAMGRGAAEGVTVVDSDGKSGADFELTDGARGGLGLSACAGAGARAVDTDADPGADEGADEGADAGPGVTAVDAGADADAGMTRSYAARNWRQTGHISQLTGDPK